MSLLDFDITLPDQAVADEARRRQLVLTKPEGSLGDLEVIGNRLAGIYGVCPPPVIDPVDITVFAGDHGVINEGVTPWPQEVTRQMVSNFLSGGAAVNVIGGVVGARIGVVDVGIASDTSDMTGIVNKNVIRGTKSIMNEPAMSKDEAERCIEVGFDIAMELAESGSKLLVTGEMGIGNTTPSAALISAICNRDASEVVGRGTGIDDASLTHKIEVVKRAVTRANTAGMRADDPISLLSELGGAEIGAIAGYILGAAQSSVPVLIDGVISLAGALVAACADARTTEYMFIGHLSTEPGARVAVSHLGLKPILDLNMRLGEGSGAALAIPVLRSASAILGSMATFEDAGVSEK